MAGQKHLRLPSELPTAVMEELRRYLSLRERKAADVLFALRATARQTDNSLTGWLSDTAGSLGRYQILMLLWAAKGRPVLHRDITAALGVTRATVSELMAALERDGMIRSSGDADDQRRLLATLTPEGDAVARKALEINTTRLRSVFQDISVTDLTTLTTLLGRVRDGFAQSK
jgi:DNA-binding MarR family transcriptional regulator